MFLGARNAPPEKQNRAPAQAGHPVSTVQPRTAGIADPVGIRGSSILLDDLGDDAGADRTAAFAD
ncbi:hypothetical protein, partial [Burkholderia cenocepacia]|uniref:hypothetical protein n=1 Tax=Burkholderia cenocepacia TaxID=95486 RepID=UPI001E45F165